MSRSVSTRIVLGALTVAGVIGTGCADREPPPPRRRVVVVQEPPPTPPPKIVYVNPGPPPAPDVVWVRPVYVRDHERWVRHEGYWRHR